MWRNRNALRIHVIGLALIREYSTRGRATEREIPLARRHLDGCAEIEKYEGVQSRQRNGPDSWGENPFVWAITFTRVEGGRP